MSAGKRIEVEWNWWPINRPSVVLCDPDEGDILVGLSWGNGNSDPVWSVAVKLGGVIAKPFIAWWGYRWDKAYRKQEARKAARATPPSVTGTA